MQLIVRSLEAGGHQATLVNVRDNFTTMLDAIRDAKPDLIRALHAVLVALDLEVDLRVDACVQLVARDDLLAFRVDHHLGDVDKKHPVDERRDPVESRSGHAAVLAEPLDQPTTRRPYHAYAHQQVDEEDEADDGGDSGDDDPGDVVHARRCCNKLAACGATAASGFRTRTTTTRGPRTRRGMRSR